MSEPSKPIDIYTPDNLASLSVGELADLYYADLDLDPLGKGQQVRAVEREVERRGLDQDQLAEAWKALVRSLARPSA